MFKHMNFILNLGSKKVLRSRDVETFSEFSGIEESDIRIVSDDILVVWSKTSKARKGK